ncbi:alpha/beta hydrolase [Tumebacillus sp. ITR2]|uniref:Alpha/beta hydrolase n=1 Tax=Tumebacillus amylolyticus TaxID=2801339 RepID=A0ABS1J4T7_9BACL|nr:alpha/beta hydrolase [Tumebacillus amylolyticus]MBL0385252.1 alpha/beta hydrolase [Tumebacillus amylolyticus]
MTLDPQVTRMMELLAKSKLPPLETLQPPAARKALTVRHLRARQAVGKLVPPEPVQEVQDRMIPVADGEIKVRIYIPERTETGPMPALVFFHGGGFVLGSLESHDEICRALTNLTPCVVISVNYRLAPEYKFPTGLWDAYAATQWVFQNAAELHLDPTRIAVGGDSAGGNLATGVCRLAKERGDFQPCFQLLLYPATDLDAQTHSKKQFAKGYQLDDTLLHYFHSHYVHHEQDFQNPLVSPLLHPLENLSTLPPAHVLTAEYDPLRDEGEAYASLLKKAGVPCTHTRYDGMVHGFLAMTAFLDQAREGLQDLAAVLRQSAFQMPS